MWVKHVHGLNLYTDKVPIQYGYTGDTGKNGKVKTFRRCAGCGQLKTPRSFSKIARTICRPCVKRIISDQA